MEHNNEQKKLPRRNFIETGITAGIGVALGLTIVKALPDEEEKEAPEMVKMLTADGKLVEVDKRHLPPMCGKPVAVSNEKLKQWMEKNKQ
ncbi:MAG: hypothetical protein Q7T20_11850 [Saprospiraceae bacterium]|nr:hypothetical protein [Saprospiraceae bacterium]